MAEDQSDYRIAIPLIKAKVKELGGTIEVLERGAACGVSAVVFSMKDAEVLETYSDNIGWACGGISSGYKNWRIFLDDIKDRELWQDAVEQPPQKPVRKCECGGTYDFNRYCGANVCDTCGNHKGLARCYCGWSATSPGQGRRELEEMGETIDPD